MNVTSHEFALQNKVIAALNSTLSLPQALEAARAPLLELTPADYAGLCLVKLGAVMEFQWLVPGHRLALLDEYSKWADSDFVRAPIFAQPNVVLRDSEMLSRKELERSALYQRSKELDLSLEHVMAVLLPVYPQLFGAFTLYRDRRLAFSERDAAFLTSLTPHLLNAVRNCREVQTVSTGWRLLEELYSRADAAFVVVAPPSHEVLRSRRAATLLERWFHPSDLHASGIPRVLMERLEALTRMTPDARLPFNVWVSLHGDAYRVVRFVELPEAEGPRQWALILHEIPLSIPLPETMRQQLTARQVDIARGMLRNWSNEQIASELGLAEDTVKTHVRDIFRRLQVDNRTDFLYQAAHLNKPV
ncbi:helix-turn-helix transcriptional regulator [Corallococcus macrosporus]|uniref:LuxR family transcriptional regulator n=1 Tax=Corallococcus macrosporus DSM 14697 TaxID=1189310 RepID=A0A250JSZ2_9BACT|nr:LuxR C-terminal-related transcriptional regulator [Corallococcus macrosporus]ATB46597.1 LuxR family transcriptional regulator [Corallococcus macrosporus DSM 14697]